MLIELEPALQTAIEAVAHAHGVFPETLARNVLRERFAVPRPPIVPQDDWERRLLAIGTDCGVSLSDEALSRESIYE